MGERRPTAAFLLFDENDRRLGVADFFLDGFEEVLIENVAFFVRREVIVGLERRRERLAILDESGHEFIEVLAVEIAYFVLSAHDKGQSRDKYPANTENRVKTVFTRIFRIGTGEIDADEPVRSFTGKTCFIEGFIFLVVLDGIEGTLHTDVVFSIDEDTFNVAVIIVIFQDFIDEELSFPVRVAGMDDRIGLLQKRTQAV